MELTRTVESWGTRDQRWLRSQHGTDSVRAVMLDLAHTSWVPATHWPDGTLKSGTPLKRVSGSEGRYRVFKTTAPESDTVVDCFLLSGGQKVPSPVNDDVAVDALFHGVIRLNYLPFQAAPNIVTATNLAGTMLQATADF